MTILKEKEKEKEKETETERERERERERIVQESAIPTFVVAKIVPFSWGKASEGGQE